MELNLSDFSSVTSGVLLWAGHTPPADTSAPLTVKSQGNSKGEPEAAGPQPQDTGLVRRGHASLTELSLCVPGAALCLSDES